MTFIHLMVLLFGVLGLISLFRGKGKHRRRARGLSIPRHAEAAYITCTFSLLGKLASEEGEIREERSQKIREFIELRFDFDDIQRALALKTYQLAGESLLEFRDYAKEFRREYPDRVDLAEQVIRKLLEYAAHEGFLSQREEELIRSAALLLGLTEPAYELIKREVIPPEKVVH